MSYWDRTPQWVDWTRQKKVWGTRLVKLLIAFIPAFWLWLYNREVWQFIKRRMALIVFALLLILAGAVMVYMGTR